MELRDEVKEFLSIVDREVGLDVFFEAALNHRHMYEIVDEQQVLDIIQMPHYSENMEDLVDELIDWHGAQEAMVLDEYTFFNLSRTIEGEM